MQGFDLFMDFISWLSQRPHAFARIKGSPEYPSITGNAKFYQTDWGVLVAIEVSGLPAPASECSLPVFGLHIHSGDRCTGNAEDPFADALTHYNPNDCQHPNHAGDLPPLFDNSGYSFQMVLTNRFTVKEIIGKTIIIHAMPDDFKTQLSGDSGIKIACGKIRTLDFPQPHAF